MALKIQTTGLEQYAPGGTARVKVLVIGGPGAGKTRWASFFPKPIYADCEGGLASVADRKVPFATIQTSQDMLDLLEFLKQEQRRPWEDRPYQTVVIDTLDAFQRKVKNEWMEKERKQVFTGWDAWGHLNAKMGLLMTRLLNLDMNVIVAVHYKDKTIKDDETGRESREIALQLQGETGDTAFNDFDLVGWMGTYWEAVDGQKVEKRGLTFKRTADKPFLKDRLYVTPPWMEVTFADSDYTNLFSRINERIEGLEASTEVGLIPDSDPNAAIPSAGVVSPAQAGSGAVPAQPQAPAKLTDYDKPTLQTMARERGLTFKGNTLKGELIAAIEEHDAKQAAKPAEAPAQAKAPTDVEKTQAASEALQRAKDNAKVPPTGVPEPTPEPTTEPVNAPEADPVPTQLRHEPAAQAPDERVQTEQGLVNPWTGEVTEAQAVKTVQDTLGGQVVAEEKAEPALPAPTPITPRGAVQGDCDDCGKDLSGERPDVVKLSKIKFKPPKPNPVKVGLCADCYAARKIAG